MPNESDYGLPAVFRGDKHDIRSLDDREPNDMDEFLSHEFDLGKLGRDFLPHLWYAGAERCVMPLHEQVAIGRSIVIREDIRTHLVWSASGKLFIKPLPSYLLNRDFWSRHIPRMCPDSCGCSGDKHCGKRKLLKVVQGFLYSYACLLTYPCDFSIAQESGLLSGNENGALITWTDWRRLAAEIIRVKHADKENIHERFHRAELRLSRLDTISRITSRSVFQLYIRGWRSYGEAMRDNLAWMAAATVFLALALTAFQTGLAVPSLADDASFVSAAYGFVIFSVVGPVVAFSLFALYLVANLIKDVPKLAKDAKGRSCKADNC